MNPRWIKAVFFASGVYDFGLGLLFLLFGLAIYRHVGIAPPNHHFYIQFPALLMMIFGVMFFEVGRNPEGGRNLMLYGAALKASFSALILWHAMRHAMPSFWVPFGWIDAAFLVLFLAAWNATARRTAEAGDGEVRI